MFLCKELLPKVEVTLALVFLGATDKELFLISQMPSVYLTRTPMGQHHGGKVHDIVQSSVSGFNGQG